MTIIESEHFRAWSYPSGKLAAIVDIVDDVVLNTELYAWQMPLEGLQVTATVPPVGAVYGYIGAGAVTVWDSASPREGILLREGRWFAFPDGCRLHFHEGAFVTVAQRVGYHGTRSFGGPIEDLGRLRYIDGCSDTLLACPPLLGDPCLNHLHFPAEVEQTFHTHPSVRCGAVARGSGWCETPDGRFPLRPGMVWQIPTGGVHRFLTTDDVLDVIAYHPDSDWGPTDEEHPMLNRTWVDGRKIDTSAEQHQHADVAGRGRI